MAKLLLSALKKPLLLRDLGQLRYLNGTSMQSLKNPTIFRFADNFNVILYQQRMYSRPTDTEKTQSKSLQHQAQTDLSEDVKPITYEKVKETTKTASYLGVILLGVGVTGIMFYAVFSELFSSKSPNSVYSKALDRVSKDTRIKDSLGEPISGYGEETRRGRRQHVSHLLYEKDGEKRLRMKFYISGSRKRATVHLEMKEDDSGNFVYRYLFVELDDFGRHPIVFEDNRNSNPGSSVSPTNKLPHDFDLSSPLNMNYSDGELK